MFGAISNTYWNTVNCAASCGREGSGNTGSCIYQKDTTMDDFTHKSDYGNYHDRVSDGGICRNYDSEKMHISLFELCYGDCNKRAGFRERWIFCGNTK